MSVQKIVIYSLLFFSLISCGQSHDKSFQSIEYLYKKINHFEREPIYHIEANQSGCYYELYINDILVFKHFKNIGLANHAVPINDAILESGIQEVTIKLYPLNDIEGAGKSDTLTERSRIKVTIFQRDKATPWEDLDYKVIKELKLPLSKDTSGTTVRLAGLPYYEGTFSFKAVVPYKLTGWSESQVLTDEDPKKIEKEVVDFYKNYSTLIKLKEVQQLENIILNREKEIIQSNFYGKEKTKKIAKEYASVLKDIEVLPIKDYKMKFYAGGKLVKLESKKYNNINNNSALITIEERDYGGKSRKAYIFHGLTLHKPKGSKKLEIIR